LKNRNEYTDEELSQDKKHASQLFQKNRLSVQEKQSSSFSPLKNFKISQNYENQARPNVSIS
jgi:hypothetical protein